MCQAANNEHFFHGISDHKARVPTPVVKSLLSRFTLSLWGDSSGPHRFSHTNSWGLSKTEPCLLPQSFKVHEHSIPNCLGHTRACSPFSQSSSVKNKTNGRRRSDYLFLQSPRDSTMAIKGAPTVTLLPCNNTSIMSRSSHIAHKGALVEVAMGQSTGSVLGVICRKRTLWCCPVVRVKLPVPYVSLGPWDSLTKFNCSKGLHQQALSTPIRPGPLSVGKVFVAFVQMCRTQTAARQGQAADLYSRLCQSKAAQAQKQ